MSDQSVCRVAIVDYGMGNLYSVKNACDRAGLTATITHRAEDITSSDAVILPGVGAFGTAMETLRRRDLVHPLKEAAASSKPFIGICLGMQLFMTESHEFGRHPGLGLIAGDVVRLTTDGNHDGRCKVPQVGWNRIHSTRGTGGNGSAGNPIWSGTLLDGLADGEFMYFVHSFFCRPEQPDVVLSTTRYGATEFCSSLQRGNLTAFQFHPERSGPGGMRFYRNLAARLNQRILEGKRA